MECVGKSKIASVQRCQSKVLRITANAPGHVSNQTLHRNLGVSYAHDIFRGKSR